MQLSVIVPVYNGGGYLAECLDSLTKQGFKKGEHEVLVINDGSTDNTESIIDEYCSKYDYFVKINKENGGVSSARNLGLDTAMGDYIAFIDGDDMFAENGYLPLLDICYKENLDGLYFGHTSDLSSFNNFSIADFKSSFRFVNAMSSVVVWNTLYKKQIIIDNKIYFDTELKFVEDWLFCFLFTNLTKRVAVCDKQVYFYRINTKSTTNELLKKEKNSYGNNNSKKYQYYTSLLSFSGKIKKFINSSPFSKNATYSLSAGMMALLWAGMINKYKPKQVVEDMKRHNVVFKDITIKNIEGNTFRLKIKSQIQFWFRHKLFYRLACFAYRVIK